MLFINFAITHFVFLSFVARLGLIKCFFLEVLVVYARTAVMMY